MRDSPPICGSLHGSHSSQSLSPSVAAYGRPPRRRTVGAGAAKRCRGGSTGARAKQESHASNGRTLPCACSSCECLRGQLGSGHCSHASRLQDFRALLQQPAGATRVAWIAALKAIEEGPTTPTLSRRLTELLCQTSNPRRGCMEAVAFLLHRRGATMHVGGFMRDFPALEFARGYISANFGAAAPTLAGDVALNHEIVAAHETVLDS